MPRRAPKRRRRANGDPNGPAVVLFTSGSVGRFLPGIDWRLEPMLGVDPGGRLVAAQRAAGSNAYVPA